MPPFHLLDFARYSLDWLNHTPAALWIVAALAALLYAYLMVTVAKRYAVWSLRRELRQLAQERRLKAIARGATLELRRSDYPRDAA